MNDAAQDADAEKDHPTQYVRFPWPVVAAGLVVLLAIVLGIGVYANRNLRPQIGLVPTSEPALVAGPLSTATPQVLTAVPTSAPTAVVQATEVATATPVPPTAAATSIPVLLASPTPSALATVEPALADEV